MKAECGKSALAKTTEYVPLPFRYINVKLIGHGATSVVLRAHDSFLDKDVAIKYMKSELTDNASVRRFQQEAKMMSSFNIMHLPMVLDFGLTDCGRPFMVMELVEGKSLKEIIRDRGPLPVDLSIEIMLQLLTAITHAHERGIVHRDLKSQNVMITWTEDKQPLVKLVDFGLAKSTVDYGFITSIGVAVGTPLYMSPEQACGKTTDERSDIYSLGCVFFEMLTGFTPFQRETITRTINAHISEPAPKLRSLRSLSTPLYSELECIIKKMLEKNPSNRYKNAKSIAEELESLFPSCVESTDQCTEQYTAVQPPTMVTSAAAEPKAPSPKLRPLTILILSLVTIILLSTTICSALDACEPQSTNSVPTFHQDGYNLVPRSHRDKFHIANKTAYALPTANDKDLHFLNDFKK
ncbi:MAG: serine/threonine protein kinase [Candidatus Obscuribacterales bacterium]|nr:serine/threonine protein kinase [Candidatus Obscuribacterales bacterium]